MSVGEEGDTSPTLSELCPGYSHPGESAQRLGIHRMTPVPRPETDMRGSIVLLWCWMSDNCPPLDCD